MGVYQSVLGAFGASLGHLGRVMERLGAGQGAATYTELTRLGRGLGVACRKILPEVPWRGDQGRGKLYKTDLYESSDTPRASGPANFDFKSIPEVPGAISTPPGLPR